MTDQAFEARLARDMADLVDTEVRPFDVRTITDRAMAAAGWTARRDALASPLARRWLVPVLLGILLALAVASALIVATPPPAPVEPWHALLIRPTDDAADPAAHGHPALDVVLADAAGDVRVVRTIRASELVEGAVAIQGGGTVSPDGWLFLYPGGSVPLPGPRGSGTGWVVVMVDLKDPARPPIVVPINGAMGPRLGPDGLVGIPCGASPDCGPGGLGDHSVRVIDLDDPDAPARIVRDVSFLGGGPEIVWAADGSGFLGRRGDGWGVTPLDGGPFVAGFPPVLSRTIHALLPGHWTSEGAEDPAGVWLDGPRVSASGDALWRLEPGPADDVLAIARGPIDGSSWASLRRVPVQLEPGDPEGSTLALLELNPDDSRAAIRIHPADETDPAHAIIVRTEQPDTDAPGVDVEGLILGWVTDATARRIVSSMPPARTAMVLEPTATMAAVRAVHAAAALLDGRVLLTGGWNGDPGSTEEPDCGVGCDRMNHTWELFDTVTTRP